MTTKVRIPRFRSSWTEQMAAWLAFVLDDYPIGSEMNDMDAAHAYTAADFLIEHWEDICNSWGNKDKWGRVVGCTYDLEYVDLELRYKLKKMSECWAKGHILVDRSSGGPDSGDMDHECARCGQYWHVPLY